MMTPLAVKQLTSIKTSLLSQIISIYPFTQLV